MDGLTAASFGAMGGAIVEIINLWGELVSWQADRRTAREHHTAQPGWQPYVDPVPDALVALSRLALGALAGFVFHGQITGQTAAVAVGASAPALLRQLGSVRTIRETVIGPTPDDDAGVPADHGPQRQPPWFADGAP